MEVVTFIHFHDVISNDAEMAGILIQGLNQRVVRGPQTQGRFGRVPLENYHHSCNSLEPR